MIQDKSHTELIHIFAFMVYSQFGIIVSVPIIVFLLYSVSSQFIVIFSSSVFSQTCGSGINHTIHQVEI